MFPVPKSLPDSFPLKSTATDCVILRIAFASNRIPFGSYSRYRRKATPDSRKVLSGKQIVLHNRQPFEPQVKLAHLCAACAGVAKVMGHINSGLLSPASAALSESTNVSIVLSSAPAELAAAASTFFSSPLAESAKVCTRAIRFGYSPSLAANVRTFPAVCHKSWCGQAGWRKRPRLAAGPGRMP